MIFIDFIITFLFYYNYIFIYYNVIYYNVIFYLMRILAVFIY